MQPSPDEAPSYVDGMSSAPSQAQIEAAVERTSEAIKRPRPGRSRLLRGCAEVREDGEHATVGVAGIGDVELGENVSDVGLDGAVAHEESLGDGVVAEAFGHEC